MSNWTHVAGMLRIDAIRFEKDKVMQFDEVFGKVLNWKDDEKVWDEADAHPERFMPLGSEGSLKRVTHINEPGHMAAYDVGVYGDLRDHHDPHAIIEWFKEVCSKVLVRNAVITATNEINGTVTWTYQEEE